MKYLFSMLLAMLASSSCSSVLARRPGDTAITPGSPISGAPSVEGTLTIVYQSNLLGEIQPCG